MFWGKLVFTFLPLSSSILAMGRSIIHDDLEGEITKINFNQATTQLLNVQRTVFSHTQTEITPFRMK